MFLVMKRSAFNVPAFSTRNWPSCSRKSSRPALFSPLLSQILPASLLEGPQAGIFAATAVFMAAMLASLALSRALVGKLPIMPLVSGVVAWRVGSDAAATNGMGGPGLLEPDHFLADRRSVPEQDPGQGVGIVVVEERLPDGLDVRLG
jgi:hypothetical protein